MNSVEFFVDGLGKGKRINAVTKPVENEEFFGHWLLGVLVILDEAIQWGLRVVVLSLDAGTNALFSDKLCRWLEKVHHQWQLVLVQIIHGLE